jgi:hypothetical protein
MSTTGRIRRGGRPLAPRAVRMRNACVRHAAAKLGLELPGDRDLSALADDTNLRDAVAWWQAQAPAVVAEADAGAARSQRRPVLLRAAVVTAVTLLGLVFSYRPVQ